MRLLPTALLLVAPALAFAQGALAPPDAPAPTMKTLDQIEPRIPIGKVGGNTASIIIDHPGSYVLLGDTTATGIAPIALLCGDVTIDLNGFTVTAQDGTAGITGMLLSGDVVIRNGRIVGSTTYNASTSTFAKSGTSYGIVFGALSGTCTVTDVTVRGVQVSGVQLPQHCSTVRRCTVSVCGSNGIVAGAISDSTAETCGNTALSALTVSNSVGLAVADAPGIRAETVVNSYGESKAGVGVLARNASSGTLGTGTATGCRGVSATGTGLLALTAENCTGETAAPAGFGLFAETATNCRGKNTTGIGLFATAATNCQGTSSSGTGLDTNNDANHYTGTATNCVGSSTSGHGLIASIATNCRGYTEAATMYGLWVSGTATGCRGTNTAINGVAVRTDIAVACTTAAGSISANSRQLMP